MKTDGDKWLKTLEKESGRLRRIVVDQALSNVMLMELNRGNS